MPEEARNSDKPRLNESLVCDVCGRFGAVEFVDRKLCPDCYENYGSCCPEFGREECEEPTSSTQTPLSRNFPP